MLQVQMKHPVLNDTGNKTAKTRYLILNIFDLLHDRHGCGRTACSLLTMLIAATLSKLSLRRLGGDNTHVTLDGNDVVVALTKFDESALIAARAFNRPAAKPTQYRVASMAQLPSRPEKRAPSATEEVDYA